MMTFMQSDRAVMRRVLGGNAGAFRVLVDRYGGVVQSVAYARLRNRADAEDIVQETFIRLYQQLDQMAHRKRIGPWLVRVARNVSVDLVRKRGRDEALAERAEGEPVDVPNPSREELHRILWEQLEAMDGDAREVLILYYFMKKRAREIAALLEISPEAAAKRVQRARDELGRRLTDYLGDELDEVRADARRTKRVMAAVIATPVGWKASAGSAAAAATATGMATGAGATKLAGAVAVVAAAAVLAYLGYGHYGRPSPRLTVTLPSTAARVKPAAVAEVTEEVVAKPEAAEKPRPASPEEAGEELEYAPVFGTVSGAVTMQDGTPAVDARVWLNNEGEVVRDIYYALRHNAPCKSNTLRFATRTDSGGRYEIHGFPLMNSNGRPVSYMLRAEKSGQFEEVDLYSSVLEREIVRNLGLRPALQLGGVLQGREGMPVANALVQVSEEISGGQIVTRFSPLGFEVLTAADGSFLFEHVKEGLYRLSVNAPGYLHFQSDQLQAGRTDYVLQLDGGSLIAGRVINKDTGEGVADVQITGTDESKIMPRKPGAFIQGSTDKEGDFEIGGCTPGTYKLNLYRRGDKELPLMLIGPKEVAVGSEPVDGLEIQMASGAVLRGTVTDGDTGLPVPPGTTVGVVVDGQGRNCKTAEGGAYEIAGLLAGDGKVTVVCQSRFKLAERYEGPVTLRRGEKETFHDIVLPARALLSGTVVDERGAPVPWASVCLSGSAENHSWTIPVLADKTGAWEFDPISEIRGERKPPSLNVQAIAEEGYSAVAGPFGVGTTVSDIVLEIVRSGRLEGEVVTRSGRPLERATLVAVGESADAALPSNQAFRAYPQLIQSNITMQRQLDGTSRFAYPQLRPGQYTLEIYPWSGDPNQPAATARVGVQPGKTTKARVVVDIESQTGGVEGLVLLNGKPAPGVRVSAGLSQCVTDAHGRYALDELSPGFYLVTVTPPGAEQTARRQQCNVVENQMARVDFELGGGGAMEGYVTSNGQGVPQVRLLVSRSEPPRELDFTVTTDADGYYRLDHVPEGLYKVLASLPYVSRTIEVQTTAGQTVRADFDFRVGTISGTITGLQDGERGRVLVLPAEAYLTEWTVEALDALGEQIVSEQEIPGNQTYSFDAIEEGAYWLALVAYPAESEFDAAAVLNGRVALSEPFTLTAGDTAEVPLNLN